MRSMSPNTARIAQVLSAGMILLTLKLGSAEEIAPRRFEGRAGLGVKSLFTVGMFGYLPLSVSGMGNLDIGRFLRLHAELTYHITGIIRPSLGAGAAFRLYGSEAPQKGGFQLKLPVIGELGFLLANNLEAGDGYWEKKVRWLILGPSVGLDFTWWRAGKAGIWVSLTGGYMFRVDIGSDYADNYSFVEEDIGTPELALLIGVAF